LASLSTARTLYDRRTVAIHSHCSVRNAMATDEQQIRDLIDTWCRAAEKGDLDAQLARVTDDVTFLSPGQPPMHRTAFAKQFTDVMKTCRLLCKADIQEITVTGDIAVTWNRLTIDITPLTPPAGGPTVQRSGDTLSVLRRGSDGQWRIWRDANMLSAVHPPSSA